MEGKQELDCLFHSKFPWEEKRASCVGASTETKAEDLCLGGRRRCRVLASGTVRHGHDGATTSLTPFQEGPNGRSKFEVDPNFRVR